MHYLFSLVSIFSLTILTLLFLVLTPFFSPFNKHISNLDSLDIFRLQQGLRYALIASTAFIPFSVFIYSSPVESTVIHTILVLIASLSIGFCIPPTVIFPSSHLLCLSINFSNSIATIHLSNISDPFSVATYRQLGFILDRTRIYPIDRIQMRSPLFCQKQSPRNFEMFEKFVGKHGYSMSSRPLKWYESLPSRFELYRLKRTTLGNSPALKKLDNCWYEVTLHRMS